MLANILNLYEAKKLDKNHQKSINGGHGSTLTCEFDYQCGPGERCVGCFCRGIGDTV